METIIGRDEECRRLWKILERQSVVLASLRRIGKTCTLKKMKAEPQEGWQTVLYIVQGKKSVEEFVQGLYNELVSKGIVKPHANRVREFYNTFLGGRTLVGDYELPELRQHWKEVLGKMLEDVAESQKPTLIMLDEFPWMLYELIITYKSEDECMELLNILRTYREQYEGQSKLRFIFCGSIGINVVLDHLVKEHKYLGNPINNMYTFVLEEMNDADATALCVHLGKSYGLDDGGGVFAHIAGSVQNLPFYIDLVFKELSQKGIAAPTLAEVDATILELVQDVSGNGNFDHFRERIDTYYSPADRLLSYLLLKTFAIENRPLSRNDILQLARLENPAIEDDSVNDALKNLARDLYLQLDVEGQFSFRYTLLQRWWKMHYC
ncbi:MAG: AAA family ATPase [Saprospiraceae bacterium]